MMKNCVFPGFLGQFLPPSRHTRHLESGECVRKPKEIVRKRTTGIGSARRWKSRSAKIVG